MLQEQKLGPMDKTERNSCKNGDTKGKRAEPVGIKTQHSSIQQPTKIEMIQYLKRNQGMEKKS
jgi:hypothetical protein